MSEANAEQNEVDEQPMPVEAEAEVGAEETQGEWLKFGIVAIVLLFTVLIIALLRPLIFGRIVPAVLGEGQPVAPLVNSETEAETIKPDADATTEDEAEAAQGDEAEEIETIEEDAADTAVSPTDSTEEAPEPEKPEDFPTAVPAQTHTVQVGETLTAIAQQYGVTVQAIVEANNITNPDRVTVGTALIIPESQ